ncbi:hypothetical protein BO71DRAFT_134624 [Aspergillus ellipticus CBS 707.79]|uniref:Uncharacterized protein n=1 Tax=Aspergillus ellipticus CBS 707.79 TaxID=1448320 RepID=A0A319EZC0_9EURO|nr:hypothetical protein BO71DRAFT_134624 [Aspergillus ellipticus CBS 707.79]
MYALDFCSDFFMHSLFLVLSYLFLSWFTIIPPISYQCPTAFLGIVITVRCAYMMFMHSRPSLRIEKRVHFLHVMTKCKHSSCYPEVPTINPSIRPSEVQSMSARVERTGIIGVQGKGVPTKTPVLVGPARADGPWPALLGCKQWEGNSARLHWSATPRDLEKDTFGHQCHIFMAIDGVRGSAR